MVDNDDPIMVRQIINAAGYDTETGIYGVGYSPDNGKTFYVQNTSAGRKFRQQDADGLWPLLIDKVKSVMSIDWDSIQNKPKFVTPDELEARLDKLSVPTVKWADIEDKPPIPSIDGLLKETELDNVKATADSAESKAEQAQSTADANTKALQNVYTKEEADRKYWTAEQEQNASNVKSVNDIEPDDQGNVNIDLTGYAKIDDIPKMPDLSGYAKTSQIPTDVVTHAELTTTKWLDTGTTWLNGNTGSIQYRSITIGNYHIVEVTGSMYITTKAYAITSAFKIPLLGFEDSTTMHFSGGSTITNEIPVAFMAGDPGEAKLYTWQNVNNGWTEVHLSWTYVGGD